MWAVGQTTCSGPVAVLLHSTAAGRRMWDPQVQPLSAAGFRLARLDFRDYGSRRVSARSRPRHDARTLLVSGAHDLPDFREIAAALQEILRDAKLIELDWAGHLPSLERPDRINPLLIDFRG